MKKKQTKEYTLEIEYINDAERHEATMDSFADWLLSFGSSIGTIKTPEKRVSDYETINASATGKGSTDAA